MSGRVRATRRLSARKAIHEFARTNAPAYTVSDGERVVVETKDCFSGLIRSEKTRFEDVSMDLVNPATGPIAVEGLTSGEALCVSIERIRCGKTGVVVCSPTLGILGKDVRKSRTRIVKIRGNRARWSDDLWIDLHPHIGVIGVSPKQGKFPTFHPGDFGGNMDTRDACEGSKVYLPTFVDGGMVSIGDVHANMGDGEICGTGIEVPSEITLRISKAPELDIRRPMIETSAEWMTFAAAKTLDEAAQLASSDMVKFIMNMRGTDFEDAYMIASVAADLRVSQVVDPLMAVRMVVSKKYL
ncbi:MAG TPA: acetamidase/formamidase family protein [Thermoplasmata archaeon]